MSEDPPAPSDPFDPLSSSQPALLVEAGSPRLRARYGDLRVPHLRLGTWPAPVQRLETLSEELGTEVWLKSEGRAGRLYGGNKVRKLEYLLADAVARGSQRVVTIGAYGSHHALATATYGRALGLEVDLVLYPQPVTAHVVDDLLASSATGATLLPSRNAVFAWLRAGWRALTQPRTVSIPAGGSSPLGALGWVEAGLELAAQVEAGELPAPEWVFVPAGTCGTVSGLALGLELAGLEATVIGVRVVPAAVTNTYWERWLRESTVKLLRRAGVPAWERRPTPVVIDPLALGGGYGASTPEAEAACERFARWGITLETTYTAKTAAAMLRWAATTKDPKRILLWNTLSDVDLAPQVAAADPATLPAGFQPALKEAGRLK